MTVRFSQSKDVSPINKIYRYSHRTMWYNLDGGDTAAAVAQRRQHRPMAIQLPQSSFRAAGWDTHASASTRWYTP